MIVDKTREVLTSGEVLSVWVFLVLTSVLIVVRDLRGSNSHIGSLMKWVWVLTVLYSGPLGLVIYWWSGRVYIQRDSLWRRGFRSVSHCYSGCGAGEVSGLIIAVGVLSLQSSLMVAVVTFSLAYTFGVAMTVGPLLQEGVDLRRALIDSFITETPSIAVMEAVAISSDIVLAAGAGLNSPLFWSSLSVSLFLGLVAAYPVNVFLVYVGVKEGMMDPRKMRPQQ